MLDLAKTKRMKTLDPSCVGVSVGLAAREALDPYANARAMRREDIASGRIAERECSALLRLPIGGAGVEVVHVIAALRLEPRRVVAVFIEQAHCFSDALARDQATRDKMR